jgi:hypothetical protein
MVECQIVALKVVGSNPTIRPDLHAYLAEMVDATDLKFVFLRKCWFESNNEQ